MFRRCYQLERSENVRPRRPLYSQPRLFQANSIFINLSSLTGHFVFRAHFLWHPSFYISFHSPVHAKLALISMPGADVPEEQKAGWASFIKSLARMTGDLSSMTAPPCKYHLTYNDNNHWHPKSHSLSHLSYWIPRLLVRTPYGVCEYLWGQGWVWACREGA